MIKVMVEYSLISLDNKYVEDDIFVWPCFPGHELCIMTHSPQSVGNGWCVVVRGGSLVMDQPLVILCNPTWTYKIISFPFGGKVITPHRSRV